MAAPEYVPTVPTDTVRAYTSPPRRPDSWAADRGGEIERRQPEGTRLGSQGPDQGYALRLANQHLAADLQLRPGEHRKDAIAGIVAVGLKRASIFGRAPILADLKVAAAIFGYLDLVPDEQLVALRSRLFEEVGHFHHYAELHEIADMVPEATLRKSLVQIEADHDTDWRSLLDLP